MAVEKLLSRKAERPFIITITVQAIVVLVVIGITFALVQNKVQFHVPLYKTIPCYLALFSLAEIFEFFMVVDALKQRNIIQLFGILLFHLGLVTFSVIQIFETRTALKNCEPTSELACPPDELWRHVKPLLIVVPCVTLAAWLCMLFWVKQLFAEFGWAIFYLVRANRETLSMYKWYQYMMCLLKFNFFSFVGVTMQLLIIVLKAASPEFRLTVTAIPVVLLLLLLCGVALEREVRWLMATSLSMMLLAMSYFYKLARFYQPSSSSKYATTRTTLTVFTVVSLILLVLTFAIGVRCLTNFGKGLREAILSAKVKRMAGLENEVELEQNRTSFSSAAQPIARRMSIA